MYAENYARFRDGGDASPSAMAAGGVGGGLGAMMQQRPRGPPGGASSLRGGGGGGYDPSMAMGMEMAPEDLARSLQPVAGRYMARRPTNAPRGLVDNRGGLSGGAGGVETQWSPTDECAPPTSMNASGYGGAAYATQPPPSMAGPRPMGRQSQPQGNEYLPPAKYRRTAEFDEFEDPRARQMMGGGPVGGGDGGPRGPPPNYRVPVNSYDLTSRNGGMNRPRGGDTGAPLGGAYTAPAPPQQQLRPPPQRAGYAQYAPPSPNTPRTQQEMMMMRRRLMEQERDGLAAGEPSTYRGNGPALPSSSAGPSPGRSAPSPSMSSAAAAWARELDPYDNARRIHRELQPPASNGGGESPMTPQASAQLRMHRAMGSAPSGYDNSPGSRIVTPAAALHNSQRGGEWAAPRRNPMANPRMVDTGASASGPSQPPPMQQQVQGMPFNYDEMELMPMGMANGGGAMPRGRMPRGPMTVPERSLPPAVAAQLSMQEYEAMMMMERELAAPPAQDPRRTGGTGSRPTSAGSNGRARGVARGPGVSPGRGMPTPPPLVNAQFLDVPYELQQANEYALPAAPPTAVAPKPAPKQARQSKAAAAREAAALQAPPAATKKRKESAAAKRKARELAEDMSLMGAGEAGEFGEPTTTALAKASAAKTNQADDNEASPVEPKRRCGRKSMNYSSEQKRERNRAAVKKCRQRQALKYEYLKRKAEVLASENRALSEMLVKNVELDDEKRNSLTRGIQMDILLKIKEIFTQSLPKDFVLDADSIWDLNSVLAVSMPSRCYYGIESIKDFWRTSLRMRNKGKIRSFWAWLFRLPPGDRFAEFTITPFSSTSNLYFINWTTKSTPALSGSIVIMFGHGHRVTLHVEIFGWLIWRYLLTNTPFPEPPLDA